MTSCAERGAQSVAYLSGQPKRALRKAYDKRECRARESESETVDSGQQSEGGRERERKRAFALVTSERPRRLPDDPVPSKTSRVDKRQATFVSFLLELLLVPAALQLCFRLARITRRQCSMW